ncbi:patatin-like phospholipase family protein [Actinomadura macrotermitis]|uniref:PNPLA domain-containing protein n=1 Tax=Actinomadura macrotermitis TaxID=2585200 RepID=A0A7K0BX41_9ACTN|nr:patatin-like phospholipase family protein [Actinomadura macrotermitis]MQY05636.1 hypothetical protein [Actinomadura macrotermitis]
MTALVLGPGGPVGTAWLLGLAAGLRKEGVDPADADLVVGTSAGAIVGALLTAGRDPAGFADVPANRPGRKSAMSTVMAEVFRVLGEPGLEHPEKLRRVGRLALAADALPEEEHLANMRFLVGTDEWPGRRLLITTVDVERGTVAVWEGGVPLVAAVSASSAAPGYARPVTLDGRLYMDGAFGGGSHVHLAAGHGPVVLAEPMPNVGGPPAGADLHLVPDTAAREAFGPDLADRTRWAPVYREGFRQGRDAATRWPLRAS